MGIKHQTNASRFASPFAPSATSPPSKVWVSIARLRDSDTARVTTTVSSPPTRPSPPLAHTQGPSSVSGTHPISRLRAVSHTFIPTSPVALALKEQVMAAGQVPVGPSDVSVDMIVTPDETIAAADGDAST